MRSSLITRACLTGAATLGALFMATPASAGGCVGYSSSGGGISIGVSYSSGGYYGGCGSTYYRARARSYQRLYGYGGYNRGYCGPGKYAYRKSGYYVAYPRRYYRPTYNNCGPSYYYGGYVRGPGTYTKYGRVPDGYSPQPRYVEPAVDPNRDRMYAPRHNAVVLDSSRVEQAVAAPVAMNRAWRMLESGHSDRALASFSEQANADLQDGTPKVGYALSAALCGDQELALWAMRRAFRIDASGAMRAPMSEGIQKRIENLAARYGRAEPTADSSFMLASCKLLLGDTEDARLAIDDAIALGDTSASAANLLALSTPADMYGPGDGTEIASPDEQEPISDDEAEASVAAR